MRLTDEQERKIIELLDKDGLKMKSLRDDILDHLCCVVEIRIKKGEAFEMALQEALIELAPNGLSEIERKTIFLLNYRRILMMKILMYLIGFVGAFTLTAGITFKLLYFPYANMLFTGGFLLLLLVFLPLYTFDKFKLAIARSLSERLKIIMGCVSGTVIGLSGVFKFLHWQGASVLLLAGAFIFAAGYLPFLFFTMYKKSVS